LSEHRARLARSHEVHPAAICGNRKSASSRLRGNNHPAASGGIVKNRSNRASDNLRRLSMLAAVAAAALCNLATSLSAQGTVGTITGVVTGEGGTPLSGVQVSIVNRGVGAITDADGRYTIGRAPTGTYSLRAQRIGFAPSTQ